MAQTKDGAGPAQTMEQQAQKQLEEELAIWQSGGPRSSSEVPPARFMFDNLLEYKTVSFSSNGSEKWKATVNLKLKNRGKIEQGGHTEDSQVTYYIYCTDDSSSDKEWSIRETDIGAQ